MSGGPELFVVCRSCGSEVSPYVTECPYCGTRVRKRAPKLDRGAPPAPKKRVRPRLSPLRPGEIPGISTRSPGKPYATIVIVALSLLGYLLWEVAVAPFWEPAGLYWQLLHESFTYPNGWYQLAVVLPLGLFGWLLEARHGPAVVIVLFLAFGIGGSAAALALGEGTLFQGAPGAALAFIAVWSVPDLRRARRGQEYDSDLLGVAVMALVVAMMPLAVPTASVIAAYAGLIGGALVGLPLSRYGQGR